MAKKKLNLDEINTERAEQTSAGNVYKSIETGASKKGQQGTASPQEIEARRSNLQTQGRKGAKAIRLNMAFTPENSDYIRTMAKATGQTMTKFINMMIDEYRANHSEIYNQLKELLKDF